MTKSKRCVTNCCQNNYYPVQGQSPVIPIPQQMPAITGLNVSGLQEKYTFELIPASPAATEAGYSDTDRSLAQIFYPAVNDGVNFYYTANLGSVTSGPTAHKSSILVARRIMDGSLVYAVNCANFNLDTSPNFTGDQSMIARNKISLLDDTLYLTSAVRTNIGPQLFAVNKNNGTLKWAIAYYTPDGAPTTITTKGNYSQYSASNQRLSSLNPKSAVIGGNKYIFVGTSSLQNAFNTGNILNTYPTYTDQGFLFCIQDNGTSGSLVWTCPTCAPNIKVGDTVVKGGNPIYDPFRPNSDVVVINSVTSPTNYLVNPYFLPNPPAPGLPNTVPIATYVVFTKTTPINASLVQPIWSLLPLNGSYIYQDGNRTTQQTLSTLLPIWQAEQNNMAANATIRHTIFSYVDVNVISLALNQPGNNNILYFKFLTSGTVVSESYDAQSLNYWGNSVWGGDIIVDGANNLVYFDSGQGHEIPMDENLLYDNPAFNAVDLKKPLIDIMNRYVAGSATISQVNQAKDTFTEVLRLDALDVAKKSPRGRLSYSDGMFAAYIQPYIANGVLVPGGSMAFGVRMISYDNYTFLGAGATTIIYPFRTFDGDVSSGPILFNQGINRYLSSASKGGLTPIIDISNLNNNVIFNSNNLADKGVSYPKLVFSGPNGTLGGANYLDSGDFNNNLLINTQGNISWSGGSRGSTGAIEPYISRDGRIFPTNDSVTQAINIPAGTFAWETDMQNRAIAETVTTNGLTFAEDTNGNLYVYNSQTGAVLWKKDGAALGLLGGVVAPNVGSNFVIWANNYVASSVFGNAGPNGAVFTVNPSLVVSSPPQIFNSLANKTFISWDSYPKYGPTPATKPLVNDSVTHKWMAQGNLLTVKATHRQFVPAFYGDFQFTLDVSKYNSTTKIIPFTQSTSGNNDRNFIYRYLQIINANSYKLVFQEVINSTLQPEITVWLKLSSS